MKIVRNILVALLTAEARLALLIHRPKIVAVTGNIGKTTTKDAIFAVLAGSFSARKSQKSFNSDIGVPLAILDLENPWSNPLKWIWALLRGLVHAFMPGYPKLLVLEVGADNPRDISSIARWLKPVIAVYTGVPEIPVHIGYFASRDQLVAEKRSLLEHIKAGGTAIVNADFDVREATKGVQAKIVTYGSSPTSDVSISDIRVMDDAGGLPSGMFARVHSNNSQYALTVTGALGKPILLSALAAFAVARELGIDSERTINAIRVWQPTPGRMRIFHGPEGSLIIDDSYNSSPTPALSALEVLSQLKGKRKIAVLGDMRELGEKSAEGHRLVGEYAGRVVDMLITVGEESKILTESARAAGLQNVREYSYDSSEQVGKDLARELKAGDIVLVKGSQNRIRLERCVYELLENKSGAEKLLVRFDTTWRKRA